MPAPVLKLMRLKVGRGLMRALLRRVAWNEKAMERGFADPKNIPAELRETLRPAVPRPMETVLNIISQGVSSARPAVAPLIIWGEQDRLTGSDVNAGRKLHASLPGSRFEVIPHAGHLPQVENPEAFVGTVESFISAQG
jgi:2-hydroxy-6-oxonona-2,4-dienedioate hydrolase